MVADSVHHFGYSRSSGLESGRVCYLMTSPFSDSIAFAVHSRKQRFPQKASFSNLSTLESVFEWLRFR